MTDNINDALEMEDMDNIVTMTDQDGNEVEFEFLDLVEYQDAEYVVLMPMDEDTGEVLILQVAQESDDEEVFVGIDDDELLAAVFAIFRERNKDYFSFAE